MRTYVLVAAALSMAACTTGRGRADLADGGSADAPLVAPAPAPAVVAAGPMDAASLARETGMRYEDQGASVLLAGTDVRARFFPGTDRVSIDGRSLTMGGVARRDGAGLVVPAAGVDAVRRAVKDAAVRRLAYQPVPLKMPTINPVAPPPKLAPLDLSGLKPAAGRRAPGADASWTAFAGPERAWKWIVIHHSDDTEGACAKYDKIHTAKGWDGCGYHWVVGNGTQSGDGEVEVGPRWRVQMHGAHAKTPDNRYNDFGIGIVLVGDFETQSRPTQRQYNALVNLTKWLMARYGIPPDRVLRHSDCKPTACPGKLFPWSTFKADLGG